MKAAEVTCFGIVCVTGLFSALIISVANYNFEVLKLHYNTSSATISLCRRN
jgi:hypothetical protein